MVKKSDEVCHAVSEIDVIENGSSRKRAQHHEVKEDISLDTPQPSHQIGNEKRRKKDNLKPELERPITFNESTTIEDLGAVDASVYLAWVAQQANRLPKVHIAPKSVDDGSHADTSKKNQKPKHSSVEDPIDGSAATLQVLFSKKMDILPAPSSRHLPPCDNSPNFIDHDLSASKRGDGSKISARECDCTRWVTNTISNFSKLRCFLELEDAKQREQSGNGCRERKIAVPRMKDRASWHVFCLGKQEAHGNVGGFFEDYDFESDSDQEGNSDNCNAGEDSDEVIEENSNLSQDRESNHSDGNKERENDGDGIASAKTYDARLVPQNGYEPTSSLLLQLDQVLTRTLFHHHVHYFCEWKFPLTRRRAAWIYALLARMEKPWHREECCAVRRVLRECCSRRWELTIPIISKYSSHEVSTNQNVHQPAGSKEHESGVGETNEMLASLNTLIAICGIYFEQSALAGGDGMKLLFSSRIE
ncbi:hypothetical protein ACHAXS_005595 [Conticribra weissflogii]